MNTYVKKLREKESRQTAKIIELKERLRRCVERRRATRSALQAAYGQCLQCGRGWLPDWSAPGTRSPLMVMPERIQGMQNTAELTGRLAAPEGAKDPGEPLELDAGPHEEKTSEAELFSFLTDNSKDGNAPDERLQEWIRGVQNTAELTGRLVAPEGAKDAGEPPELDAGPHEEKTREADLFNFLSTDREDGYAPDVKERIMMKRKFFKTIRSRKLNEMNHYRRSHH